MERGGAETPRRARERGAETTKTATKKILAHIRDQAVSEEQKAKFLKRLNASSFGESRQFMLEEQKQKVRQDADFAKDWDIGAHLHALEGEIERIEL